MKPPRLARPARAPAPMDAAAVERRLSEAAAHFAASRLTEAARIYEAIEQHDPSDVRAPFSLATIDLRQGRLESARRRLRRVTAGDPGLFAAHQNLGAACQALGDWEEARGAYARALALRPDATETGFSLATALTLLGRSDEAVALYRALARHAAVRHRALTRLAILRPDAVNEAELAELRRAAHDPSLDETTRTGLWFALGDVLERRRADDEAFDAYAAGNALKRRALAAAPDPRDRPEAVALANEDSVRFLASRFTPDFIAAHQGDGHRTATPIFIVGMPRSGSTLIEQILAAHPKTQGLGETPVLSELLNAGFPYAAAAPDRPDPFRRLAERYLEAMRGRGWRPGARPVDKTLESYLHVGAISLMFPRAVILHSVRDPVDTGLACFRQLFASGAETLYDLGEIGAEYVRYRRMMQHWAAVLPGRVIDVSYEALVADPPGQIRWLVTEACGLAWDPACLEFHRAAGTVRTASAAQVRQPIFSGSVARWRRYETRLAPLLEALGPYAEADRPA